MRKTLFILLCVMIVTASCVREQSQDASVKPNIETDKECVITQNITTEKNYIKPSQVIYHTRLDPEPLTNKQLAWLSKYIKRARLDQKEIWFVRVILNRNQYLNAVIYFIPDITSSRIRKGKYIHCKHNPRLVSKLGEETLKFEAREYCQVSLKEKPFTPQIEIPPQNSLLPFAVPKDFSEQEIVDIVDFILSAPKEKAKTCINLIYAGIFQNLPIIRIKREGEIIRVKTGTQEHGIAGSGLILEIRKTGEDYELIMTTVWVS